MKLKSWLSTCSSTTTAAATPPPKSPFSDTTSIYSSDQSPLTTSSIQSSLSLLTLPSVPSLQKLALSPDDHHYSTFHPSATFLASFNHHHRNTHTTINFLTIHNSLLYAATGSQINVYDTSTNTLLDTFNAEKTPSGSIKSIEFSNGKIFTAHQDCTIRVWKLNTEKNHHKLVATLPTAKDRLTRFFLPQNYVKVRRHTKKLWIEHHDAVSGLARHGNSVFSVSWDGSLKVWGGKNLRCVESVNKAHHDAINAVVVSGDGVLYTGSADRLIKVWKKEESFKKKNEKYELVATLEKHKSAVNALALSEDGSVLFSGSCDRSILVWEREDSANYMTVSGALRGHGKAILCLINVRDLLMSGSADRTVRVWMRGGGGRYCCLTVLEGHRMPVRSLAAVEEEQEEQETAGGGLKVFSGSFDGDIRVWQIERGTK